MKALFFIAFAAYAVSVILEFTGTAFRKEKLLRAAWIAFIAAFALHTVFIVARGVAAKRLPLSNQFEFANGFAWGVALFTIAVCTRMKTEWLKVAAIPVTLLIMTYAALQPMEIRDLMPALRSAWFGVHIGSAVLSYAASVIAGCIGARYLKHKKKEGDNQKALDQMALPHGRDPLRRDLGRAGLVRLLDLGPQGGLGADHLDHLRGLSPSASARQKERQTDGMVSRDRGLCRVLYLCGRQHAAARHAHLRLMKNCFQIRETVVC